MTPAQLKGSIIQAAIQGKLVEQRPSDSDVDEAISSMAQERERLIKEGKLKKEGKINKTADTEIEIPSTWRLIPLRELVCKRVDNRGKTPPHSLIKNPNECIDLLEIASIIPGKSIDHSKVEKYVTEETYNQQRGFIEKDDILIATVGSIGKFALMDDTKSAVAQNIIAIKCFDLVEQHYIFYLLQSPYFYSAMGCIKMEAVQASIKVPDLMNLNVPLPPIEEQRRIVAKIEELLPFVDRYAASYEKLEQFNAKFPEDMKKSILQYAIQGKLVEQRPEEGSAEELYKAIQKEKQKLIKEGKIKKEKPLAEITEDEIPFDIPDSWRWVRFAEFGSYKKGPFGSALTKSMFVPKGKDTIKVYEQKNAIQKDATLGEYYITKEYYEKSMTGFEVHSGDVIVSCAGTIGETFIMPDNIEKGIINQALMRMQLMPSVYKPYFLLFFDVVLKKNAIKSSKGSAIKNIPPFDELKAYLVPLPPHEEPHRIVAKIEELLPYCDRLVK